MTWDLSIRPGASQEVFAGCNDGLQQSSDGGTTWSTVALPGAPTGWVRIEVAHAPSDGGVVYVFACGSSGAGPWTGYIWRRGVVGGAFTAVPLPPGLGVGQAWYDWAAAVAPNNPDLLYVAGVDVHRGARSATNTWTWTKISAKSAGDSIHPDQHHITFSPADPNVVYVGNDGGIYRSPDMGTSWRALNKGLQITEFEYLANHPQYDAWLLGGTQDNGTERYEGGEVWFHIQDGDGGDCGINSATPSTCFHTFYSMGIERSTTGGGWGSWSGVGPPVPSGYSALFYPPLEVNGTVVAQAGQSIFISTDSGTTWSEVALPAGETATALAIPTAARVYAGTGSGNIYRTDLVGTAWGAAVALTAPRAGYVSDLMVDPLNTMRLWATYSNVTGSHVYRSDNGGTTWADMSAGLPTISANAIVVDPTDSNSVYLAMDVGVYRSADAGSTWTAFNNQLPNALATDLVFHQSSRTLRVGTRNRGAWEINVDRATMPDVEVYLRDSALDTGRRTPSPSGLNPFITGSQTYWWESRDLKVDSPPYQFAALTDVDFERFEDDHGPSPGGLLHENAERTKKVRVFAQVHNRGVQSATNVAVKVFYASAALGLPNLPAGFWTNFPNNVLAASSPWQEIAPHQVVPIVRCGHPEIVPFEWTVPAGQASHSCLLAIASAQNDSIATAELNIANLVLGQAKCGLKNLAIVDPLVIAHRPFVLLDVWWWFRGGRFAIGLDQDVGETVRGVILNRRYADAAKRSELKGRRLTPGERQQLTRYLKEARLKPEEFEINQLFLPRKGPWLQVPAIEQREPDRMVVLFGPRPRPGRFAFVQWTADGVPAGGFTFEVAGKG
jgi:photosystem II stability/assembly factor-like uncharacterized protein